MNRLFHTDNRIFQKALEAEVENIIEKKSFFHRISSAIRAREANLDQLTHIIVHLS